MSTTTQATTPIGATVQPSTRDKLIADADNLPDLIARAQTIDPELFDRLNGKAMAASATAPGVFAVWLVTTLATNLGTNWTAATDQEIAGALVLLVGYAMHWLRNRSLLTTVAAPKV